VSVIFKIIFVAYLKKKSFNEFFCRFVGGLPSCKIANSLKSSHFPIIALLWTNTKPDIVFPDDLSNLSIYCPTKIVRYFSRSSHINMCVIRQYCGRKDNGGCRRVHYSTSDTAMSWGGGRGCRMHSIPLTRYTTPPPYKQNRTLS